MSESHLPDDVAKWPDDPYALLGVDHSVDRRSLRQAYVRLIRVYRPEHYHRLWTGNPRRRKLSRYETCIGRRNSLRVGVRSKIGAPG
jgi:preprotein translocase subunit Sec63